MPDRALVVERVGAQVLVQDLGRPGQAHLGVPRSGALDLPAHRLAHRLVGNPEDHATLECLCLPGSPALRVRLQVAATIAVTGARVPVHVDGRAVAWGDAVSVGRGAVVELGSPTGGLRAYLAVSGGVAVEPVLGSRATDQLSGLGPDPVAEGDVLPLGEPVGPPASVDVTREPAAGRELELRLGPRDDWFTPASLARLDGAAYVVGSDSNRVGVRLQGEPLERAEQGELPSEPMVLGAVQVPPSGQPVLFLADHPTTGGYPVVGVLTAASVAACAQLRPGDEVVLRVRR